MRVFVAVRSLEMAATIAIRERSTSRRKAARTWQTSPQPVCPARWTSSLPTMTACSAHTSAYGLPCPSIPTRWSSRRLSTRRLTMETGMSNYEWLNERNKYVICFWEILLNELNRKAVVRHRKLCFYKCMITSVGVWFKKCKYRTRNIWAYWSVFSCRSITSIYKLLIQ